MQLARMSTADRAKYDTEIKLEIILPDRPTLIALVDFGDVAKSLMPCEMHQKIQSTLSMAVHFSPLTS
jgi:hypothetical protein